MGTASPGPGHLLNAVRIGTLCTVRNQFQTQPKRLKVLILIVLSLGLVSWLEISSYLVSFVLLGNALG